MPLDSVQVDAALLASLPLPDPDDTTEKHERGTVVVVGGTRRTPGAVRLAGVAALRVGAGKLQLVTDAETCDALGVAVPEALVAPFAAVEDLCDRADVVLVGPGTFNDDNAAQLLKSVLASVGPDTSVVIDAGALGAMATMTALDAGLAERCVLTPNPGELATLLGVALDTVQAEPDAALRDAVARFSCVITLRGPEARTAGPNSPVVVDTAGNPGLGTSGSGDVSVGALAGLLGRGAPPLTAAVWANHVHRRAGERCAGRIGPVGYLASDLLVELPRALAEVSGTAPPLPPTAP
ncbi:MAG: ADP-dependent NAD(P)H-hydrate dehydratase [Actinomycetota bacterium]